MAVLLVALTGCSGATLHQRAMDHNATAAILIEEGALEQARANLEVALEYNPRFSEAHANLGLVAVREGRLDEAERRFRRAVALNSDFAEAWTNLASISLHRGAVEAALGQAHRAVEVDPGFPEARIVLIRALIRAGDLDEARDHAERLLAVRPGEARSHALRAMVALASGVHDLAELEVRRAFELDEHHLLAREVRGRLLLSRGQGRRAVPDLEAALAARHTDLDLRYFLGLALLQAGEPDDVRRAEEQLRNVLRRRPSHARALTALALIEAAHGRRDQASELLASALNAQPGLEEALRICRQLGEPCDPEAER